MKKICHIGMLIAILLLLLTPSLATMQPEPNKYTWREVVTGLDNPLLVTHAGDDRLFAVEQGGYVLLIENGEINPQPYLDVSLLLSDDVIRGGYSERGLLGVAFDPNFATNNRVYVSYINRDGHSVLARYTGQDVADESSRVELLLVEQPFADHNGGAIAFGPDGYLYMGIGDGGNPDIPNTNGQDPQTLLGKMLRLDVSSDTYAIPDSNPFVDDPAVLPEIWAFGVRNPWRFSFDRVTGDLFIGDVGQWNWEELNIQLAEQSRRRKLWLERI